MSTSWSCRLTVIAWLWFSPVSAIGADSIDPRAHGADPSGRRDSRVAFERAIRDATEKGRPLRVPSGRYRIVLTRENPSIRFAGRLTIQGDGPTRSILDVEPKIQHDVSHWLLETHDPRSRVELRDFKVVGATSTTTPPAEMLAQNVVQAGLLQALIQPPFSNEHSIRISNFELDAPGWRVGVWSNNGPGRIEILGSKLHTLFDVVNAYESSLSTRDKSVVIRDSELWSGQPSPLGRGEGSGVCVYAHPHVSVVCENVIFRGNRRAAVKQYSSEQDPPFPPRESRLERCRFVDCLGYGIIGPGLEGVTTIVRDCDMGGASVGLHNDTIVERCRFQGGGLSIPAGGSEARFPVLARNCSFELNGPGNFVQAELATVELTLEQCQFRATAGSELGTIGIVLTADAPPVVNAEGRALVKDCQFDMEGRGGGEGSPLGSFLSIGGSQPARVGVEGTRFRGQPVMGAIRTLARTDDMMISIHGCDFQEIREPGRAIGFDGDAAGSWTGLVLVEDCVFGQSRFTGQGSFPGAGYTPRRLARATTAQVQPDARLNLDRDSLTHEILGSGEIRSIHLVDKEGRDHASWLRGRLLSSSRDGITFAPGGNVDTTQPITVARGGMFSLEFDRRSGRWRVRLAISP